MSSFLPSAFLLSAPSSDGSSRREGVLGVVLVVFCLCVLVGLLGACAKRTAPPPPQMTLEIKPKPNANKGQVFYMVVRSTNEKQYLTETYAGIAALVFADPPDANVLGAFPIFPGKNEKIKVVQPRQNPVAFYFLFTDPSDDWRHLVAQPLASTYEITIEQDSVVIGSRRGLFRRFQKY